MVKVHFVEEQRHEVGVLGVPHVKWVLWRCLGLRRRPKVPVVVGRADKVDYWVCSLEWHRSPVTKGCAGGLQQWVALDAGGGAWQRWG